MCNNDYLTVLTLERNNLTSQNLIQRFEVIIFNGVDYVIITFGVLRCVAYIE